MLFRSVASALYGRELYGSVTRLERFARCAYSYFLEYGLNLKERDIFSFEARDMGNVYHESLRIYSELVSESGHSWLDIPSEKSDELIDTAVKRCMDEGDYVILYSSFRNRYMIERIRRILKRTVDTLTWQLKKGSFSPHRFELSFSSNDGIKALEYELSEDERLKLYGKIDRVDIYEDPSADIDARIEDLLSQMTLDEKTCQMVTLYGYRRVLPDQLPTPEWKDKLWKDGIGAIDEHLNSFVGWNRPPSTESPYIWPASTHAKALNEVQKWFIEETRLGIPVDFTNEGIRGVEAYKSTNFPTQLGLGHTWDRELIRQVGYITGREGRLLGYTNIYAPILDVGRDQRWGRYEEIYGEDPYLVAQLGIQMVKGLQQNYQVAATAKHFAIYSAGKGAREGSARCDPHEPPHEVENIHMYPWREVIREAGLLGAMSSYNDYDGVPVSGSKYFLTDLLRKEWGFKGLISEDAIPQANYCVLKEAVISGVTMTCKTGDNTMEAVAEKWPYWTIENVSRDERLLRALKADMKWQAFALANSNAMDGMSSSSRLIQVRTWYDNLLTGLQFFFAVCTLFNLVLLYKAKKRK